MTLRWHRMSREQRRLARKRYRTVTLGRGGFIHRGDGSRIPPSIVPCDEMRINLDRLISEEQGVFDRLCHGEDHKTHIA